MNKTIISLFFLVVFSMNFVNAQECNGELTIFVQFIHSQIESESGLHNFPDYVQGDSLQINKIIIKNLGKCDSPSIRFNLKLKKLSGKEIIFCPTGLIIDSIKPEFSNTLSFYGITTDVKHGVERSWLGYEDSIKKKYTWCGRGLIEPGIWSIEDDIQALDSSSNYKFLLAVLDEKNELRHTGFTVYSTNELELVSDTKKLVKLTKVLTWLTFIMALVAILQIITSLETIVKFYKKIYKRIKKKSQKSLKPKN